MKNKEIEESIKRIKEIVDFYKLNDENNYDYSDAVLISMKNLLSYIEQLENNRDKAIEYIANIICDEKARVRHDLCGKDIDGLINILKGDSDGNL